MQSINYDNFIIQYLEKKDNLKSGILPITPPPLMRSLNYCKWKNAQKQLSNKPSEITEILVKCAAGTHHILYRTNDRYWCITLDMNGLSRINPLE